MSGEPGRVYSRTLARAVKKKSLVMLYTSVPYSLLQPGGKASGATLLVVRMFDFDIAQAGFFMAPSRYWRWFRRRGSKIAPTGYQGAIRRTKGEILFCLPRAVDYPFLQHRHYNEKRRLPCYISAFFSMFFLAPKWRRPRKYARPSAREPLTALCHWPRSSRRSYGVRSCLDTYRTPSASRISRLSR